jgi:alpha-beta hydrolase superfamily lysophospholipase
MMAYRVLLLGAVPLVLVVGHVACAQQGPAGVWTGSMKRDGSDLAVEMSFSHTDSGYVGSFSSFQLRAIGIPFKSVRYQAPAFHWEIVEDETLLFDGTLHGDTLFGHFLDGTDSGTFVLARRMKAEAPLRETEVTFANGAVSLSGTIVTPAGAGPFPGIVFLQGSGAEGRWASRYLAEAFARRGIASLIYDKRGVGRSTGDWRTSDFSDLVRDGEAAVETLRSNPHVASGYVGIYGHSQGATIAPWLASDDRHVAFVVAAAGGSARMAEMETYSLENDVGVRSLPDTERLLAQRYVRALVATAYEGAPRSELDRVWNEVRGHAWASEAPPDSNYYWAFSRRTAAYNPLEYWPRVTVPTLLIYGEDDERVPARLSAGRIAQAYIGANGTALDVIMYPLADHNFRLHRSVTGTFEWPKSAPGFPERLIDWVLKASKP